MARGIVCFVSPRGSGYIRCADNTDIIFFRPRIRSDTLFLKPGQRVEFQVVPGARGRHADQLVLVK